MSKNRYKNLDPDRAARAESEALPITDHSSPITSSCFHCNEPIPAHVNVIAPVGGVARPFCCSGCRAVAELIAGAGLQDYYRFRDTPAKRVQLESNSDWFKFDSDEVLSQLTELDGETRSASLVLDGIGCAACGWLIDRAVSREAGVVAVNMNAATARLRVRWRPDEIRLSRILQLLANLGYTPHLAAGSDHTRDERRTALKRLAVAGFGMMQVMMIAVAFYADNWNGAAMESQVRTYLRYVSLLCATPVLLYAGWPFLMNALRAIRARTVVMDVPVSIGLLLAYFASLWNTVRGAGEVYFDSVTMFVFFLTLGRFVEMIARHRTGSLTDALARMMPQTARRILESGEFEDVPVRSLAIGDRVIVRSGEVVPVDGVIVEGSSHVDESLLTGESLPMPRNAGAALIGGSVNLQSPLTIRVTALGRNSTLSGIVRLLQRAESDKAPQAAAADRAASWFLARVVIGAGAVAAIWSLIDPTRAFEITLSVLVVTCPCALSLAVPAALAATTASLAKHGVLVANSAALEALAKITRVVFDKTGTLTRGEPVARCDASADVTEQKCLRIAAALERGSDHPIARAFASVEFAGVATNVVAGEGGIEGIVEGIRYRVGTRTYATGESDQADREIYLTRCLASGRHVLATFVLTDALRPEASRVVAELRTRQLATEVLSGDAWMSVAEIARECGIAEYTARQTPVGKLAYVRELIERGDVVAVVGDGVNDAPVFKAANVSIAMARGSALAQVSADVVLLGDSLQALPIAIDSARRAQRVINQNLIWAATYNLLALPLAAMGWVPPWLAAIGMSFSSLVVVANAMRLAPRHKGRDAGHEMRDTPETESELQSSPASRVPRLVPRRVRQ